MRKIGIANKDIKKGQSITITFDLLEDKLKSDKIDFTPQGEYLSKAKICGILYEKISALVLENPDVDEQLAIKKLALRYNSAHHIYPLARLYKEVVRSLKIGGEKMKENGLKSAIKVLESELEGIAKVTGWREKDIHTSQQKISYLRLKNQELLESSISIKKAISKLEEEFPIISFESKYGMTKEEEARAKKFLESLKEKNATKAEGGLNKNGDEIDGVPGWCALCNYHLGSSSKYLNGKFYHLGCYPQAVEIYLADLKLEKEEEK